MPTIEERVKKLVSEQLEVKQEEVVRHFSLILFNLNALSTAAARSDLIEFIDQRLELCRRSRR